jgi:type II secretory pathway pseudopilin PulG
MSDRRVPIAAILLEAAFVVLGVFLALVANDWRSERDAQDRAARARVGLIDEARHNREAFREALAYHSAVLDSLGSRAQRGAPPPTPALFTRGFVDPATARSTAWDAATATDALAAMDYDEVLTFSELYAAQQRYGLVVEGAGGVIYQALFDVGAQGVAANAGNLASMIGSFRYLEAEMVERYDAALDALGASAESTAAE